MRILKEWKESGIYQKKCMKISNSSAPPPDLPHRGGGNVFPPPLVGGVRGGGKTDMNYSFLFVFVCANLWLNSCSFKIPDNTNPFVLPHIQDH